MTMPAVSCVCWKTPKKLCYRLFFTGFGVFLAIYLLLQSGNLLFQGLHLADSHFCGGTNQKSQRYQHEKHRIDPAEDFTIIKETIHKSGDPQQKEDCAPNKHTGLLAIKLS